MNIDVGYISLVKLVLAITKNHSHRLYLGEYPQMKVLDMAFWQVGFDYK